jgi:hypothetical protein
MAAETSPKRAQAMSRKDRECHLSMSSGFFSHNYQIH